MNCIINIKRANKRDWIQASSAIYEFEKQVRAGLGHDCYVNCPLDEGLSDFWGPLQHYGAEDGTDVIVNVSRDDGRLAYPKHNLMHAYSHLFLRRDADTVAGTWKFHGTDQRYFNRLVDQRKKTTFQWKPGYVAWVPPLTDDDSAPKKMPLARLNFWKSFMTKLINEEDYPVQVLDIRETNYTKNEEAIDPGLVSELAQDHGIREVICLELCDLADWLLGASFLICEENWIHDLAACLSVPSFIVGCHDYELNTAYHYAFHGFPLRYYLTNPQQPFEVLHAFRELSIFQSLQSHVR